MANTIKTAEVHMGRINDLVELCEKLTVPETDADALTLVVMMKRAEQALEKFKANLSDKANQVFLGMLAADPSKGIWNVGTLATVTKYTPAGTWEYPSNVIAAINNAEREKALAQAHGTARKVPGKLKAGGCMFSVTLAAPEIPCDPNS